MHPVLGGLLHYSVISLEPTIGLDVAERHGHALRDKEGIWANAVFGRFRDTSYRWEMVPLAALMTRKDTFLRDLGWPEDKDGVTNTDTIGGAACFMAFGHVDAYMSVHPSVVRPWTAHFAETIVKAHHVDTLRRLSERHAVSEIPCGDEISDLIERLGYSNPDSNYPLIRSVRGAPATSYFETYYGNFMLLPEYYKKPLQHLAKYNREAFSGDRRDPSSYCPADVLWSYICLADYHMRCLKDIVHGQVVDSLLAWPLTGSVIDSMIARSISTLAVVGAPSYGDAAEVVRNWPSTFLQACEGPLDNLEKEGFPSLRCEAGLFRRMIRLLAELTLLRSAYYTVLMRAAHPIGPGLTEESNIETALAYMA